MKCTWSLILSSVVLSCGGSTVGTSSEGGDASAGSGGSGGHGGSASGGSPGSGGISGNGGSSAGGSAGPGGSGAAGGGQGGAPGSDAGACVPSCGVGFICCGSACVNPNNDIFNCGTCGNRCGGTSAFCDHGMCGTPPCGPGAPSSCEGGAGVCCDTDCCTGGKICCHIMAGIETTRCVDPVNGTCPVGCPLCVCASPDTPIAVPEGVRPIESLQAGDLVYSFDHGELVVVPIEATQRIAVDRHRVVRVVLDSGVVLEISGRHPTADGRTFADLQPGDQLDGVDIREVSAVPYGHAFTYDILPASETGAYFAGGVLVGSTMAKHPISVHGVTVPTSR